MGEEKRYTKCRYHTQDLVHATHYCSDNAKTLGELLENRQEIDVSQCVKCEKFKSKYIKEEPEKETSVKPKKDVIFKNPGYWCGACGIRILRTVGGQQFTFQYETKYCPNCGQKIDWEDK